MASSGVCLARILQRELAGKRQDEMKAQLGGRRNNKYKGIGLGSLDAAQAGSSEALAAAKHAGEREGKKQPAEMAAVR